MTRSKTYSIVQDGQAALFVTITIPTVDIDKYSDYLWDSRLGIVTAIYKKDENDEGKRIVVPSSGKVVGSIEPAPFLTTNISSIDYDYWYY